MEIIDLRTTRCPISLVLLKKFLLAQQKTVAPAQMSLSLLFANQQAMQDILRYLDKKGGKYSTNKQDNSVTLRLPFK